MQRDITSSCRVYHLFTEGFDTLDLKDAKPLWRNWRSERAGRKFASGSNSRVRSLFPERSLLAPLSHSAYGSFLRVSARSLLTRKVSNGSNSPVRRAVGERPVFARSGRQVST